MTKLNKNTRYLKSAFTAIVCLALFFSVTVNDALRVRAAYWPSSVMVESGAAIVMEQNTGVILYEKNAHVENYPASITKIMTALLAVENCEMDEVVTFSKDAVYKCEGDTSHIARDVGEKMTMEQCLYGMMLESANECAYAIGEHVAGGDINKFVDMMNTKAKDLGCKNTHFVNPNGLPDEKHYTSAYDMALISRAAFNNETFAKITGTKSYTIPPTNKHAEETLLNNHHAMLNYYQTNKHLYEYCVGGKTGYTEAAGSTLVTYAKKNGMTLVCVTMNGAGAAHYTDTRALLDYCFDNFSSYSVKDNPEMFSVAADNATGTLNLDKNYIKLSSNGTVVLPRTADFSEATSSIKVNKDSKPDESGVVATISYTYSDRYVGGADLIFVNDETVPYPFDNVDEEYGGSSLRSVKIDFKIILLVLLALAVIAGIVYFIYIKSADILLFKKRKIDSRKKEKPRYQVIKSSRRRRRRRRW